MHPTVRSALLWASLSVALAWSGAATRAADGERVLTYTAEHARYGQIGTYSNIISTIGDITKVHTKVNLRVRVLGITAHREEADRTEQWKNGRLIAFNGVTVSNGDRTEVKGEAKGDQFVVFGPAGLVDAPANVRVSNPWSNNFIGATSMLFTDNGTTEPVSVSKGEKTTVTIGGAPVKATRYDIHSKPAYQVWLDADNVPVMFNVAHESGLVTFTLVK